MPDKPKILCVGQPASEYVGLLDRFPEGFDLVQVNSRLRAFAQLARTNFAAIYVYPEPGERDGLALAKWTQSERILESMPDGVALLNVDNAIVWANQRLRDWTGKDDLSECNFYSAFDGPEILGPDFCPFHSAIASGEASGSLLRCTSSDRYFHVHAAPVQESKGPTQFLIVTVRDVTLETRQKKKLAAIHKAGVELSELTPDDVCEMQVEDRIELLKQNILFYTKDLLKFDVVEIRLIDQSTGELVPLLSEGMVDDAMGRALYARPQDNGVTVLLPRPVRVICAKTRLRIRFTSRGAKEPRVP